MAGMTRRNRTGTAVPFVLMLVSLWVHTAALAEADLLIESSAAGDGSCATEAAGFGWASFSTRSCQSGGRGTRSCQSGEGLRPMGVHDGCGISCAEGYYACCNRGDLFSNPSCICLPVPASPYTPGELLFRTDGRGA